MRMSRRTAISIAIIVVGSVVFAFQWRRHGSSLLHARAHSSDSNSPVVVDESADLETLAGSHEQISQAIVSIGVTNDVADAISNHVVNSMMSFQEGDFGVLHRDMENRGHSLNSSARAVLEKWGPEYRPDIDEARWASGNVLELMDLLAAHPEARHAKFEAIGMDDVKVGKGLMPPRDLGTAVHRSKISSYASSRTHELAKLVMQEDESVDGVWVWIPVRYSDGVTGALRFVCVVEDSSGEWHPYRLDSISEESAPRRFLY